MPKQRPTDQATKSGSEHSSNTFRAYKLIGRFRKVWVLGISESDEDEMCAWVSKSPTRTDQKQCIATCDNMLEQDIIYKWAPNCALGLTTELNSNGVGFCVCAKLNRAWHLCFKKVGLSSGKVKGRFGRLG